MDGYETSAAPQRAVIVALVTGKQTYEKTLEYLDELEFLTSTMGVSTAKQYVQRMEHPENRTFVGKGKQIGRAHV